MTDTERLLTLILYQLEDAIKEADELAPVEIDRVKIKRLKQPWLAIQEALEPEKMKDDDYYTEEEGPIMLIPFEKLRERVISILDGEVKHGT